MSNLLIRYKQFFLEFSSKYYHFLPKLFPFSIRSLTFLLNSSKYLGKEELIKLFIEKGADANAKYQENWAPLHRATYLGLDKVAGALIEKKADINVKNVEGYTGTYYFDKFLDLFFMRFNVFSVQSVQLCM